MGTTCHAMRDPCSAHLPCMAGTCSSSRGASRTVGGRSDATTRRSSSSCVHGTLRRATLAAHVLSRWHSNPMLAGMAHHEWRPLHSLRRRPYGPRRHQQLYRRAVLRLPRDSLLALAARALRAERAPHRRVRPVYVRQHGEKQARRVRIGSDLAGPQPPPFSPTAYLALPSSLCPLPLEPALSAPPQFRRGRYEVGDYTIRAPTLPNTGGEWGSRGRCLRRRFDPSVPTRFMSERTLSELLGSTRDRPRLHLSPHRTFFLPYLTEASRATSQAAATSRGWRGSSGSMLSPTTRRTSTRQVPCAASPPPLQACLQPSRHTASAERHLPLISP